MEQYHDVLAKEGQCAKRVYWQEDKKLFRANLETLKQTMTRIHAIAHEFEGLTEIAYLNVTSTYALISDINATAEQLGLSPIPLNRIGLLKIPEENN